MKEFNITIPIKAWGNDELNNSDAALIAKAREATSRAYVPYSKFHVGAAILLDNGEIITGANQENAAYPSGTCAERTACYYAHATYPEAAFDTIAIAAIGTDGKEVEHPIPPCGACRQALVEYETLAGHPVRVLLAGHDVVYELPSVKSLLPITFDSF